MATILNGDIIVDYLSDNRQKRLSWITTTPTNTTYTINEIYSAMATLLDESTTIDDGTCFSAETPTEYTIGQIDTGDTEPWYITFDLMEHVTGGALRTSGWTRTTGTNTGIIVVPVAPGGSIATADEGYDVTGATTGAGTLLEFIDTGGTYDYLVIRPDSSVAGHDFTTASQVITSARGAFTATQWATAASTTGNMIWAGLYSLGTIDSNVHQYLYQGAVDTDGNRVRLTSWNDATQDWLDNFATNGHIDTTVALKDIEQSTWSIIDSGYVTVLARKYGDYYASFEVACSTTSGGYNPVPLGSSTDIDNTTGIKIITTGAFTGGPFTVGEIISQASSLARGIVTSQVADTSISYIPIDDPQIPFVTTQVITGASSNATATSSGAEAVAGPATSAWFTNTTTPTIAFTHTTADIDDDGTNENYGIVINCQSNPLTEVYEWVKYATRNGETTNDLDGINGEDYIGAEVYLSYTGARSGTINEGSNVTQETSGATGVIVAHYDSGGSGGYFLLRDTRGTFTTHATLATLTSEDDTQTVEIDGSVSTFAPKTASPLGTFAGGTFFGARGVLLTGYLNADANSFILTPAEGGTKSRPASFTITVSNLVGGAATSNLHDKVAVFRLTGDGEDIDKTEYSVNGIQAQGLPTLTVSGSITQDTPGKSTGGVLILVDSSDAGAEYKLRYNSWSGSAFALREITGTADAGTDATTLVNDTTDPATFTDGADQVYRGDCVTVVGKGSAHVKTVDSNTQLTLESPGIPGFTTGDAYEINTLPVATEAAADFAYVPFIHEVASAATATQSVIYVAQIFYRGKVRNTRATTKIKPFSVDGDTEGGDVSIATIRTTDTIIT